MHQLIQSEAVLTLKIWIVFLSTLTTPSTTISAPGLRLVNPVVQSPNVICCPVESVAVPAEISTILADPANLGYEDEPELHDPKSLAVWTI